MMDAMELHGRGMADARERINQTELALERTEEMLAENIALCSRIRRVVEAADRLVKIDPPAMKVPPAVMMRHRHREHCQSLRTVVEPFQLASSLVRDAVSPTSPDTTRVVGDDHRGKTKRRQHCRSPS